MEIEIKREKALTGYDTGGGIREVKAIIEIDPNLHPRVLRHIAIYETLGCYLGYVLTHEQLEELTTGLVDVFDQIEPIPEV